MFEIEPLPAESLLWDLPNVILTRKIGGMSDVYLKQALPVVLHNLTAWIRSNAEALRNRGTLQ